MKSDLQSKDRYFFELNDLLSTKEWTEAHLINRCLFSLIITAKMLKKKLTNDRIT